MDVFYCVSQVSGHPIPIENHWLYALNNKTFDKTFTSRFAFKCGPQLCVQKTQDLCAIQKSQERKKRDKKILNARPRLVNNTALHFANESGKCAHPRWTMRKKQEAEETLFLKKHIQVETLQGKTTELCKRKCWKHCCYRAGQQKKHKNANGKKFTAGSAEKTKRN